MWFAFGERELRPYPSTPPQWHVDAQQQRVNEWQAAFTEGDLTSAAESQDDGNEPKRGEILETFEVNEPK